MRTFFLINLSYLITLVFTDCPSGTIHGIGSTYCYQPFNDPASWISADYKCMRLGGHLASIGNAFLNDLLNGAAQANFAGSSGFWLGSTTMFEPGQWLWSDGNNSTYTNWGLGQPVSNNGSYCVSQHLSDIKWYSEDCSLSRPYFCEIPQTSPNNNTNNNTNCSSQCPTLPVLNGTYFRGGQWFYLGLTGKCYLMVATDYGGDPSFVTARKFCQQYGADDLVVINAYAENYIIGNYISNFSSYTNWGISNEAMIGLFNNGSGWQWVDGTVPTFTNWQSGNNLNETGWTALDFGPGPSYNNTWRVKNYSLNVEGDGCALFICQKIMNAYEIQWDEGYRKYLSESPRDYQTSARTSKKRSS